MSDAIPICGRCGKAMGESVFTLTLEEELAQSVSQELQLCSRCVKSFERWHGKRGKSSSTFAARLQSEGSSALPAMFGSNHHSTRRHRRKKQMHRIFVVTSLTILTFLLVFYGTWTILKTATRVEE